MPEDAVKSFGKDTLLGRAGQPYELAPSYVYLASDIDSSYVTGQVLHVDGGEFRSS
jgi:NAD(P)-dependent dehydrogenase (short-subunit alcohol dehydrogenase family)